MMILMYVSSQTVPESAIEDDGTKNKKYSRVRNLENKILQNTFSAKGKRRLDRTVSP